MQVLLSDGSEVTFGELSQKEFSLKCKQQNLEGNIYRFLQNTLGKQEVQAAILSNFPKPQIHRRNTGYAIDVLLDMQPFSEEGPAFNMCKLLAGSEGTLAFTTGITLQLDELPPVHRVMVAAHFTTVSDCCNAVAPLMRHPLYSCEMMDKVILDCTKSNKTYAPNRSFIEGDPEAILTLELCASDKDSLEDLKNHLLHTLHTETKSYANPILFGDGITKAEELRKAGLGLLGNMIGDKKAVACIEDTAVALDDLAPYITEFSSLMDSYGQKAVYYAHAGAGELHLRPILNLKKKEDVELFRKITTDVALLVKKYNGSMSGEHGDGRVRAEFIELMVGKENYETLRQLKNTFDANHLLNPGKIIDAEPMDTFLRYVPDAPTKEIPTILNFSDSQGIIRAAEKCNGSGDCRKSAVFNGVMCPSYQATKNEKDTTRARANALREFLTNSDKENKFNHKELKQVFDLCLSCKACSSECPSNVDVASFKAEFLYQYRMANGSSLRDKLFAYNSNFNRFAAKFPWLVNGVFKNKILSSILKKGAGIHPLRSLPLISTTKLKHYAKSANNKSSTENKVILFIDEFSSWLEAEIAKDCIDVLQRLGYSVQLYFGESGRTLISKGYLKEAKVIANTHIKDLAPLVSQDVPLIGIEPSAILTFKDEYLRLCDDLETAHKIASATYMIEEFLALEISKGTITSAQFTTKPQKIKFHGHCHQKALSHQKYSFDVLNIPKNYSVTILNTGCCGMAGSFGYEKEHYQISMQIGELKLFPAVRSASSDVIIAANGTSCRHQILDGTKRISKHPITILKEALLV